MKIASHSSSGSGLPGLPPIAEHELVCPIASGAYGQVWLARNALGTYRAIKLFHRANFDHDRPFEREFAGIQRYEPISRSHEGLVGLLQVGRNRAPTDHRSALVTRRFPGSLELTHSVSG
jgi:hypothetical protein